jgi:hypothetical protein
MKYFVAWIVLCSFQQMAPTKVGAVAAQGSPKQGVTEQKRSLKPEETKQPDQNHKSSSDVVPPIAEQPSAHVPGTQAAQSSEDIEIQRRLVEFTKWLAIVGALQFLALIVQAVVFWRTLRAVRTQVDLMGVHAKHLENLAIAATNNAVSAKENAEAAKLNAEAFITESRPWLLLHKNVRPEGPHSLWETLVRIYNFGKTPAKVIAFEVEMQIGESRESPPQPEVFDRENLFSPFFLPQGEEINKDFAVKNQQDVKDIAEGRKQLWLCGVVKYRSTFESLQPTVYETLFCFRSELVISSRKWMRGPDKYNKAT